MCPACFRETMLPSKATEYRKERTVNTTTRQPRTNGLAITPLQGDAWAAWNASYFALARDAYRSLGRALYRQDIHERITALFARSDEQNRYLDTILSMKEDQER
jgi:hypothetical protein